MDRSTILLRFGLAFLGAPAFGLGRQRMGKPVGFESLVPLGLPPMATARSITVDHETGSISLVYMIDRPGIDQFVLLEELTANEHVRRSSIES